MKSEMKRERLQWMLQEYKGSLILWTIIYADKFKKHKTFQDYTRKKQNLDALITSNEIEAVIKKTPK